MRSREESANENWKRLAAGIEFAFRVHASQLRKGTNAPYISHLLAVAGLVLEHGGSEDQAVAALLHDALEDVGGHLEPVIREQFGDKVAEIVLGCTDADSFPKPPWQQRKDAYIRHLETATADTLLVSLADKVHNARAICVDLRTEGQVVFDRFKGKRDGTLWYYDTLAAVFERLIPGALASELRDTVERMKRLADSD